jgi:hypothetical protein
MTRTNHLKSGLATEMSLVKSFTLLVQYYY